MLLERMAAAERHRDYLSTIHKDAAIGLALSLPMPSSTTSSQILMETWKLDISGSLTREKSCRLTLLAAIGCLIGLFARAVASWFTACTGNATPA